ncbi:protein decapping 5-like [Macadamia integrifolia]|uniref:protein decapping 5-like n=1 Tax=Macadamia integrifolia TaxID=60698 RepID=UPI001C4F5ADD|nr:protein decapping 5-like [Macadamia integrifolia]
MAESGKSDSPADSYIGSLISLTSKYEIRYEGVLYNIDTEESTIGLQNVRSFGTEGRKKDGPQIPSSDKVYEYILFRGSDIKDLQVKSSPPVHAEQQVHNDPAIIQSHYASGPSGSSNSASVGGGALTDLSFHGESTASARVAYPGALPLYQPGGYWGSSPATQNSNGLSLSMPLSWQGYYGSSGGLPQAQQQSMPFQPPSTISVPLMLQNQLQYPEVLESLSTSTANLSELAAPVPSNVPTANSVALKFSSSLNSAISTSLSDVPSSLFIKASVPSHSSSNLLTISSLPLSSQYVNPIAASISGKGGSAPLPVLPVQSLPYSSPSIAGSISGSLLTKPPTLLTPDHLMQPGPPASSSIQIPYSDQKNVDGPMAASAKPSSSVSTPLQLPLLPLPLSTQKFDESVAYSKPSNGEDRGNYGQGSHQSVTDYTEEFDFIAMNEKFRKDEVWGYLGKAKERLKAEGTEDSPDEQYAEYGQGDEAPKSTVKPVYNKDDFFDTLSCNSVTRGAWNGRIRFSERMKLDTETFGDFPQRAYSGHGGRGIGRAGNYRGSYYNWGRGYGYGARGRGHLPI